MLTEADLRINPTVYEWTGRTIGLLEKVLRVNIKLHHVRGQLADGEIFLFNHFARFETFIPQYLIYREVGALCRSLAAPEFFREGDPFSRYLLSLGAVPADYADLLPFLVAEVLRGRKVIVFPEGGMVKDRRVLDRTGRYSIYSRTSMERRKHHTGAAVVALAVDGFKTAVREAEAAQRWDLLEGWASRLGLDGIQPLLGAGRRPTVIVPANITFYPIRLTQNLLKRGAELFNRGLSPRLAEELLIEGNILLTHTDMDIRLGDPVVAADHWSPWERRLLRRVARRAPRLEAFLDPAAEVGGWEGWLLGRRARARALRMRDAYMVRMYEGVTVNLSHLASRIVFRLLDRQVEEVAAERFHRTLYLAVKGVQGQEGVHLHRSLRNPEAYEGVLDGTCPGLDQLVETATGAGLLERTEDAYRFRSKLREEHGFDRIRIENLLAVYTNEVEPIAAVNRAVDRAIAEGPKAEERRLALLRFDDERLAHAWDRAAFRKPRHEEVNRDETASLGGEPFLLLPERGRRSLGVLLVHGFTASPAEVRPLADKLEDRGYPTLGVRLKGHGTSPWDLLERTWEDWYASVRKGYRILAALAERVCLVGFSGGGALCLRYAAEAPADLAGVVAVAAPVKIRDKAMTLVPLVHGANVLVDSVSAARGIMLFHHSDPEHPEINYQHMPIRALYELGQLIDEMEEHLGEVRCPVLLVQGTEDPTVDPKSARDILEGLTGTGEKSLVMVPSDRHGLLFEDVGETHPRILRFLEEVGAGG